LIPSCAVKEKYGSDVDTADDSNSDDSDSESDESEDEDGEELTPAVDVAILRTLARIKARDPGIYETGRSVFEGMYPTFFCIFSPACPVLIHNILTEEHNQSRTLPEPSRTKKSKSNKPVTLHEQRIAAALDVATTRSSSPEAPSPPPTHVAEQAALRAETIAAFHSSAADTGYAEQQDEGGLFTLREKTRDEVEQEEAEYRAYLEREVGPLEEILDLGEEEKTEWTLRKEEKDMHVPLGEADSGKKNKKKKGKKIVEKREETDQEFLIKYVCSQHYNISDNDTSFSVVTFYTGAGSIAPRDAYLPTRRSLWGLHLPKTQVLQ
jgi:protein KRI1